MRFQDCYSHPTIFLSDHLIEVTHSMRTHIQGEIYHNFPINKEILLQIGTIIGLFHDFGKITSFFQNKLKTHQDHPLSHHSCISALVAAELTKNLLRNCTHIPPNSCVSIPAIGNTIIPPFLMDISNLLPLLVFIVIRRHHGDLLTYLDEFNDENLGNLTEWRSVTQQCSKITQDHELIASLIEFYQKTLINFSIITSIVSISDFMDEFLIGIQDLEKIKTIIVEYRRIFFNYQRNIISLQTKTPQESDLTLTLYLTSQYLFSILIDSDKKIAAQIGDLDEIRVEIPSNVVDKYITDHFSTIKNEGINQLRTQFYDELISVNYSYLAKNRDQVFSITAPTGIGKTLATMSFALKLRDYIQNEYHNLPRIIYCLPFTSIIDQNFESLSSVLQEQIPNYTNHEEQYILKHHHLTEMIYRTQDKELSNSEALLLVESWNSEIILTTFYQLFYTIFGYSNSNLKKFHKLAQSILILDEIQAFPPEFWYPLRYCLLFCVKYLQTKVIFLTATQPAIFDPHERIELVAHPSKFYENPYLNRIQFEFFPQKLFLNQVLEKLKAQFTNFPSVILVTNTINESILVCKYLLNNLTGIIPISQIEEHYSPNEFKGDAFSTSYILVYLSTNIIPTTRKTRIQFIKHFIKIKQNFFVITTQLIEAGVDIDASLVIRDFGPLDSIIQVAGRCNREKKGKEKGILRIYRILNDSSRLYCHSIYSKNLIQKTEDTIEIFRKSKSFPWEESIFPQLTDHYFKTILDDQKYSHKYLEILKHLIYGTKSEEKQKVKNAPIASIRDFRIFEEGFQAVDVLIILNDAVYGLFNNLSDLFLELESIHPNLDRQLYFSLKSQVKQIQRQLREYTISMPTNYTLHANLPMKMNLVIIDQSNKTRYYDNLTGFIRQNVDAV